MLKKGAGDKYIACAASIFERMDGFAAATFWKQTPTGRRERLGAGSKCAVCPRFKRLPVGVCFQKVTAANPV